MQNYDSASMLQEVKWGWGVGGKRACVCVCVSVCVFVCMLVFVC
jgi:hypothetical protein